VGRVWDNGGPVPGENWANNMPLRWVGFGTTGVRCLGRTGPTTCPSGG